MIETEKIGDFGEEAITVPAVKPLSSLLPRLPAQRFESPRDIESPVPIEIAEFRKSPRSEFCFSSATVSGATLRSGRKVESVESWLSGPCAPKKRLLLRSESSVVLCPSAPNTALGDEEKYNGHHGTRMHDIIERWVSFPSASQTLFTQFLFHRGLLAKNAARQIGVRAVWTGLIQHDGSKNKSESLTSGVR